MHRKSVLLAVPCDLKKLPIGGLEAFVLSQVQERSRLEEVAESAGLELDEMVRLAERLSELGALVVEDERARSRRPSSAHMRAAKNTAPPASERALASMVPIGAVPLLRKTADLRALQIGAREGFVLSQIDGATSVGDLAEITRLSLRELQETLQALEAAGAVDMPNRKRRTSTPAQGTPSQAPQSRRSTPAKGTPSQSPQRRASTPAKGTPSQSPQRRGSTPAHSARSEPPKGGSAPAQSARSEAPKSGRRSSRAMLAAAPAKPALPDASDADRAMIAEMAQRIDVASHYEALGVEPDSDSKTIRRAYHALAAQFHPDRFYGKNLGPQKQPLERIFDRITKAYDTLSRKAEREAHDAFLGLDVRVPRRSSMPARRSSRKMKAAARVSSSKIEAARPASSKPPARPSSAKLEAARTSRAPKTVATPPPAGARTATPIPGPAKVPSTGASARNASVTSVPSITSVTVKATTPPPASGKASSPSHAGVKVPSMPPSAGAMSSPMRVARADALLRMFAGKQQRASREHIGVFLRAAKEAVEKDDLVAAANHYRLAIQCTDDPAVHAAFADVEAKAKVRVYDASLVQAKAAESAGRWPEAAAKFARAYETRPEPWVAERTANAMRLEGKDLKRAAHFAEQAVLAEPQNAAYRVTLGEIYLDAGVMTRAAGESGRASALAPNDPRVRALATRVAQAKRG